MPKPTIAIVGRPNVGKSALFNRIVGARIAIVHDEPGITRDRISVEAEWRGIPFTIIDTGGIGLKEGEKASDAIQAAILEQVHIAIDSADLIILVTDVREGVVPLDNDIAIRLRKWNKPVVVAVNKVDNPSQEKEVVEFHSLGFDHVVPISALHDRNINQLMKIVINLLPEHLIESATQKTPQEGPPPLRLAIVGRPNVGKSSLVNALVQHSRVVVSPIPGTTRDAIEVPFEIETEGRKQRYILVDTAGLRKRRSIKEPVDFYSTVRTEDAIARSDIVIFLLDAEVGITELDKKIAGKITELARACIIAVNKWDLYVNTIAKELRKKGKNQRRTEQQKLAEYTNWIHQMLYFLDFAPVIFISATERLNLNRLLDAVRYVGDQLRQRIPTSLLNKILHDAVEAHQPPRAGTKRLKLYYATQIKTSPPTFLLFVNYPELFTDQYNRYLIHCLRKAFGFEGCFIKLIARPRPQRKIHERPITSTNH